ncbi:MAG: DUF5996 family protein [Xanthobacteraceae bacterium]
MAAPLSAPGPKPWPQLDYSGWADTCATLQLWTQVVGKVRLALAPHVNHWWQVALYVTARGLTTSPMPYRGQYVQIDFDFIDHRLLIRMSDGRQEQLALVPRTVADFYHEVMRHLRALGVEVRIWTMPVEIPDAIPFDADNVHASYDAKAAHTFWRQLVQVDRVFKNFRSPFLGKCSPVHFFWGSFDLAVTRFSGRAAPPIMRAAPNVGQWVMQEAYSHEVSSAGFWPGNGGFGKPAFYAYAYPEPEGFAQAKVRPQEAHYDSALGEFVLPYDTVAQSATPDDTLLEFLQATYEAAADRGKWDRELLERNIIRGFELH